MPADNLASKRRPLQILLAEDCISDVLRIRKALQSMAIPTVLTVVEDGERLLRYLVDALKLEQAESKLVFPDVVLLDLNMPKLDGFKALELIAAQPSCGALPLVVISSSADPDDVRLAYQLGAHAYIDKGLGRREFVEHLQFLERMWSEGATLVRNPSNRRH